MTRNCRMELCRYWPGEGCMAGVMPCDADAPGDYGGCGGCGGAGTVEAPHCTCGDCDCPEDCEHPNCEAAEWADREKRTIPAAFQGAKP